jgi:hypothetical protein
MTKLQMPVSLPMWELCNFRITRPELRSMLGEPHVVETDGTRTYGGEEDGWAFVLASGQRIVIQLRVPYGIAVFAADPPELDPVLCALKIAPDDLRLTRYREPVAVK